VSVFRHEQNCKGSSDGRRRFPRRRIHADSACCCGLNLGKPSGERL
jgi:hypothetical protein